MNMPWIRWSPERDDQLRTLAANELTAERIAATLGPDFTRNMVIGRASRIGVSLGSARGPGRKPRPQPQLRTPTRRAPQEPTRRTKPSLASVAALEAVPSAPEPAVARVDTKARTFGPVTIDDLRFPISQCRWIDGAPTAGSVYCGAETKPGKSYCPAHFARVWAPYRRSAA